MIIGAIEMTTNDICTRVNGNVNRHKYFAVSKKSTSISKCIVRPNAIPPNQYVRGILERSLLILLLKRLLKRYLNIVSSPVGVLHAAID